MATGRKGGLAKEDADMETDAGRRPTGKNQGIRIFRSLICSHSALAIKLWHKRFSFSKRVNKQLGIVSGLLQLAGGSLCGYLGKRDI